jgi:hypothetical protein
MAKVAPQRSRTVAEVDYLVDENGARLEVPDDTSLKVATDIEQSVGGTGPANWWRLGLAALAVIVVVILVMQLAGGGAPGTDVQPGTPTAEDAV